MLRYGVRDIWALGHSFFLSFFLPICDVSPKDQVFLSVGGVGRRRRRSLRFGWNLGEADWKMNNEPVSNSNHNTSMFKWSRFCADVCLAANEWVIFAIHCVWGIMEQIDICLLKALERLLFSIQVCFYGTNYKLQVQVKKRSSFTATSPISWRYSFFPLLKTGKILETVKFSSSQLP